MINCCFRSTLNVPMRAVVRGVSCVSAYDCKWCVFVALTATFAYIFTYTCTCVIYIIHGPIFQLIKANFCECLCLVLYCITYLCSHAAVFSGFSASEMLPALHYPEIFARAHEDDVHDSWHCWGWNKWRSNCSFNVMYPSKGQNDALR